MPRAADQAAAAAVASCLLQAGAPCGRRLRFVKGRWAACTLRRAKGARGRLGGGEQLQAIRPNEAAAAGR